MQPLNTAVSGLLDVDAKTAARQAWVMGIASGMSDREAARASEEVRAIKTQHQEAIAQMQSDLRVLGIAQSEQSFAELCRMVSQLQIEVLFTGRPLQQWEAQHNGR